MALTKQNLAQDVRKDLRLSYNESAYLVEQFLELMKSTISLWRRRPYQRVREILCPRKKSRRGRNLYTGNDLTLSARRVVTFKPSGVLRRKLNGRG